MIGKTKGATVIDRLFQLFGEFKFEDRDPQAQQGPFWSLIETILSQNTTFQNSHASFLNVFLKYRTVDEIAKANPQDLEALIRGSGLYRTKATRIIDLAKVVMCEYHGDAALLLQGTYHEARERLTLLKGVGPKTADVVLLFLCDYPIIPVDTHIFRVAKRIGIAPQNGHYEVVKCSLEGQIPPLQRGYAHKALIRFGREICHARRPDHDACPITDICDYYQSMLSLETIALLR